jgi:hypothetical protein
VTVLQRLLPFAALEKDLAQELCHARFDKGPGDSVGALGAFEWLETGFREASNPKVR